MAEALLPLMMMGQMGGQGGSTGSNILTGVFNYESEMAKLRAQQQAFRVQTLQQQGQSYNDQVFQGGEQAMGRIQAYRNSSAQNQHVNTLANMLTNNRILQNNVDGKINRLGNESLKIGQQQDGLESIVSNNFLSEQQLTQGLVQNEVQFKDKLQKDRAIAQQQLSQREDYFDFQMAKNTALTSQEVTRGADLLSKNSALAAQEIARGASSLQKQKAVDGFTTMLYSNMGSMLGLNNTENNSVNQYSQYKDDQQMLRHPSAAITASKPIHHRVTPPPIVPDIPANVPASTIVPANVPANTVVPAGVLPTPTVPSKKPLKLPYRPAGYHSTYNSPNHPYVGATKIGPATTIPNITPANVPAVPSKPVNPVGYDFPNNFL